MKRPPYLRRIFVAMNFTSLSTSVQKLRVLPLLLVFIGTFVFARNTFAQLTDTLRCDSSITINLGSVLGGDSLVVPISFINELGAKDTSWSISGVPSNISFSKTTGSAGVGQSWPTALIIKTNISDTSGTVLTRDTLFASDSCSTYFIIEATEIGPTANYSIFSLQNTLPEVIAVQSNADSTSRLFYFKNDSSSAITIDSVYITGTPAFLIDSEPSFHVPIQPQGSFFIGLSYTRSSQGSDNGFLAISRPNHPIAPFEIALRGVRLPNDAVQMQPTASTHFWLYPNPAQGPVTIHTENLAKAHVTITDVLGRIEQETSFRGDWQWNRQTEGGSFAPAGTYFILVTGEDGNGKSVHQVERIALE